MALKTLENSLEEAAGLLDVDYVNDVEPEFKPDIQMAGTIVIGDREFPAFRAHAGTDENAFGKGGIRMHQYETADEAKKVAMELAAEMMVKGSVSGIDGVIGAKGVIGMSTEEDPEVRLEAMRQFAGLMKAAGLAGAYKDVPAGDVGVGSDMTDAYANAYHDLSPDDPFWQASITGKSPGNGGLDFRNAATGWGSFVTQRTLMGARNEQFAPTTVQGFGAAGSYHAHFVSQAVNHGSVETPLVAVSDIDGTLLTQDPAGIEITKEMVTTVGEDQTNKHKIHQLQEMVADNQGVKTEIVPSKAITEIPTGYFAPAALNDAITAGNVHRLGATSGVIEVGNGVTTPEAHRIMTKKGLIIGVDTKTNVGGMSISLEEREANLAGRNPSYDEMQRHLTASSEQTVKRVLRAAEQLDTQDMRVAMGAVSISFMLRHKRPDLYRQFMADAAA